MSHHFDEIFTQKTMDAFDLGISNGLLEALESGIDCFMSAPFRSASFSVSS